MTAMRKSVWVPADRKLHFDVDLPADVPEGEADVTLVVYPRKQADREKVVACLKDVASRIDLLAGPDPGEWLREIREDRALPGRS